MDGFSRISVEQAHTIIEQGEPLIVDVRDPQSYTTSHIAGAVHLDNDNVAGFLQQAARERPLIVYCYHGNSSLSAGQFLQQQGFQQVMSMDGGFEAWRQQYAVS